MSDKPDYIRVTVCPVSDPPAQVRVIRSELLHSMAVKDLISWVGQPTPSNLLPDSINVSLSHAF